MEQEDGRPREEEEEEEAAEAGSAEEEEGGAAGCAVSCRRDGVVGLMVAGPLRPLRLRPPSPAPRYQPPIPLLVPQGSTALPPTNPPLLSALSRSPTLALAPFHPTAEDAGSGPSPHHAAHPALLADTRRRRRRRARLRRRKPAAQPAARPAAQPPALRSTLAVAPFAAPAAHFPRANQRFAMLVIAH